MVADSSGSDNVDGLNGWDRTLEGEFTYGQIREALKGAWEVSGALSEDKAQQIQEMLNSGKESDLADEAGELEVAVQDAEDETLLEAIKYGVDNSIFKNKYTTIDPEEYFRIVSEADASFNHSIINREFITSVVNQESGFTIDAVSPVGAVGIAQFLADTAEEYGVKDRYDPEQSTYGMYRYFIRIYNLTQDRFPNKSQSELRRLTLAGYNAGPWNDTVEEGRIPQNGETDVYVSRIEDYYDELLEDIVNSRDTAEKEHQERTREAEEKAQREAEEEKRRLEEEAKDVREAEEKAQREAEEKSSTRSRRNGGKTRHQQVARSS